MLGLCWGVVFTKHSPFQQLVIQSLKSKRGAGAGFVLFLKNHRSVRRWGAEGSCPSAPFDLIYKSHTVSGVV